MDKAKKTEVIDDYLTKAFNDIARDFEGKIKFTSDSNYSNGRIIIKVID